ncbi:MAG: hypothetical protein D3915_15690, partial [Candidatus Electrothrix sp. AU1_5]|nr:hypothetical protein [Candidatus Electrothrix gigas]
MEKCHLTGFTLDFGEDTFRLFKRIKIPMRSSYWLYSPAIFFCSVQLATAACTLETTGATFSGIDSSTIKIAGLSVT